MTRAARARREALRDAVAEGRVREVGRWDQADPGDGAREREGLRVVGGLGDPQRDLPALLVLLGRCEPDVQVAVRVDRRLDVEVLTAAHRRRRERAVPRERCAAVHGYRHPQVHGSAARSAVEHGPERVDVVLVGMPGDVVHRDPLLVLDMPVLKAGGVRRLLERLAIVRGDPVPAHVVAVRRHDRGVRMQVLPVRVERQRHLVRAAPGVEVDIRVRVHRPGRGHVLRSDRRAVIALHLVVGDRRAAEDRVGPEVEVVEGAPLRDEELRVADQVFGARLHGDPGFGVVRVERLRSAFAGQVRVGHRLDGIATAQDGSARDGVGECDGARPQPARGRVVGRRLEHQREREDQGASVSEG